MPARLRDIASVLRKLGIEVEEPKKGSHFMLRPAFLSTSAGKATAAGSAAVGGLSLAYLLGWL